jgi:Flp pilus assembly protein TadD/ketosteroid isomerase-like protein
MTDSTRTLRRTPLAFVAALVVFGCTAAGAQQPASGAGAAVDPTSAEIQRLIKDGHHTQALRLIDEALTRNPKDPQMRFRRGVALSMLDRKAEALAVFQKLVDDHPEMPAPYNNIAVIQGSQGEYDKARQTLEKAIRTNPAYATAYQNLGDVYAQLASQAYTKALQLDKADQSVPPKLALLRELAAGPNTAPPAPAARPTAKPVAPPPTAVVAAPMPKTTAPPAPAPSPAVAPAASAPAPVAAGPAPAPSPALKPAPPASPASSAEAEAAVRAWARAWAQRDMAAYYAAYHPDFKGQASSRKAWEQDRRDRIATRKQIKVELQDLRVHVDGDKATAKFRQVYASDALTANSRKTLQLVRSNGRWVIRTESVGN